MANPTSTGIGQGAAQVFDTNGITNLYGQILQRRQLQEERDSQVSAELMRQYDPNKQGLRSDDLKEYNELYNKYKNVYLSNKDLYRNPLKNQKAYNEAMQLAEQMNTIKAESVEFTKTLAETGKRMADNSERFSNETKDAFNSIMRLPVSQIKKMYGGRLPTALDFEQYRQQIPYDKLFDGMNKDLDGASRFEEVGKIERWDSPAGKAYGIPEGQEGRFVTRKYKPEDVSQLSLYVVANQQTHDNIMSEIKDAVKTPEGQKRLGDLQNWYNSNYNQKGDGMPVNVTTPEGYLTASYLQKHGVKEIRPEKFTENQDYKIKQEIAQTNRKNAAELTLYKKKVKAQEESDLRVMDERNKNKPKSTDDILKEQSDTIISALDSGVDSEDAMVNLNAAYPDNKSIKFVAPAAGEKEDDFIDRVRTKGAGYISSSALSNEDLKEMYKSKKGAYIVEKENGSVVFKGSQKSKELAARVNAALNRTPKTTTTKGLTGGTNRKVEE